MDWLQDVKIMQVDITSYCNAACGTCARYVPESDDMHPLMELNHFDVELYERLVTYDIKDSNIESVHFNGNFGDFSMHPHILDIVEISKKAGLLVEMSTNGSPRTTKFWHKLAGLLTPYDNVTFCIDGTSQESNETYRRKTVYSKILNNMKAFNDNGGKSIWTMTVFNHNINELQEAKTIAENLGCSRFETRMSHEDYIKFTTHEVFTDLVKDEHIFHETFKIMEYIDVFENDLQKKTPCYFYKRSMIQIDAYGTVWPCCYISQKSFGIDPLPGEPYAKNKDDIFTNTLKEKLTLRKYTLAEILTSNFFTKFIPDGVDKGSLEVCQNNCGLVPINDLE